MGAFPTRITSDEYAMADTLVIDEGGIDLLLDGDSVMAASFEGLDPYRLMFEILPEDFVPQSTFTQEEWNNAVAEATESKENATEEEIAEALDLASNILVSTLYNIAILKGWTK